MPPVNDTRETVVIVAPYWRHPGQVGNHRVDRFARWLAEAGCHVGIVRSGTVDASLETAAGSEVTIRDPLNLYPEDAAAPPNERARRPSALRRFAAYAALSPDPLIIWSRRVASHRLVDDLMRDATWVITSSPPESIHIAGLAMARRHDVRLCVDMRDGWLDEPLKPLLQRFALQRWREGRMEARVVEGAERVFVTSDLWKEALEGRLPSSQGKTTVLTNAYPEETTPSRTKQVPSRERVGPKMIDLLHAGRLSLSRNTGTPSLLLQPIHEALASGSLDGSICFLGDLGGSDMRDIDEWKPHFAARNWAITNEPSLPRPEMIERLARADGLLLVSGSRCPIPSKLFEYISARKPILAVTVRDSATWRVGEKVPQMFCVDPAAGNAGESVAAFLDACAGGAYDVAVPEVYTEEHLRETFLAGLFSPGSPQRTAE